MEKSFEQARKENLWKGILRLDELELWAAGVCGAAEGSQQPLSHRVSWGLGLAVICPAVCSCIYSLCLLLPKQLEICAGVYVCVSVCLFLCVCCSLCGPGRTGNFLFQCVRGFWLELCWSCLCCSCVVGVGVGGGVWGKKIEALVMAGRT